MLLFLTRSRWIVDKELVVLLQSAPIPWTQNERLQRHGEKGRLQAVPTEYVLQRAAAREQQLQQLLSVRHVPPHHGRSCPLCLQRFVFFTHFSLFCPFKQQMILFLLFTTNFSLNQFVVQLFFQRINDQVFDFCLRSAFQLLTSQGFRPSS